MNILHEKRNRIIDYYHAISIYYAYLISSLSCNNKPIDLSHYPIELKYALLSLISLNLIYKKEDIIKEDIIEKKDQINYESKMYDYILDNYKIGDFKTTSSSEMFSIIKNKLAHGDYYIDKDDVVLNKNGKEMRININLLAKFNLSLSKCFINGYKEDTYVRTIFASRAGLVVKENISETNIDTAIRMMTLKTFTFKSMDKSIIPIRVKNEIEADIDIIEKYMNTSNDYKNHEEMIRKKYEKRGYSLIIENKKIKDKNLIENIKQIIQKRKTELDKKNRASQLFLLGDIVHKQVDPGMPKDGIWIGLFLNQTILTNMIASNNYNLFDLFKMSGPMAKILASNSELEIISALLARFEVLYMYPLDDIYKKSNEYHLNRDNEFDFSLLNLDAFKPAVLKIERPAINENYAILNSLFKKINELKEMIYRNDVSITEIIDKPEVVAKIKSNNAKYNKSLEELQEKYRQQSKLYYDVCRDYEVNRKYFNNRCIIEGIRNAIAHGLVEIVNPADCQFIGEILINFKSFHNEKLCFDITLKISDFEKLFDDENIYYLFTYLEKMENQKKH